MCSRSLMVISPRGSPGRRHSASGAFLWMSTSPFFTATPDDGRRQALAHGLSAGGHVQVESVLVALGDDLAVLDHDDAPGGAAVGARRTPSRRRRPARACCAAGRVAVAFASPIGHGAYRSWDAGAMPAAAAAASPRPASRRSATACSRARAARPRCAGACRRGR